MKLLERGNICPFVRLTGRLTPAMQKERPMAKTIEPQPLPPPIRVTLSRFGRRTIVFRGPTVMINRNC